jgi:hypothetical protein
VCATGERSGNSRLRKTVLLEKADIWLGVRKSIYVGLVCIQIEGNKQIFNKVCSVRLLECCTKGYLTSTQVPWLIRAYVVYESLRVTYEPCIFYANPRMNHRTRKIREEKASYFANLTTAL